MSSTPAIPSLQHLKEVNISFPNGSVKQYDHPLRLNELLQEEAFTKAHAHLVDRENSNSKLVPAESTCIIAARVNNYVLNLNKKIIYSKASVEPVYENTVVGNEIMRHSLLFLLSMACHQLYPKKVIYAEHHLGFGYLCDSADIQVTPEFCENLTKHMNMLIDQNLPIMEVKMSHDEALEYFTEINRPYTVSLLKRKNDPTVRVDYCGGYYEIHTRTLAPSTSFLKDKFSLQMRSENAFVLNFPPDPFQLNYKYDDSEVIKVYEQSNKWGEWMDISCVGALNKKIRETNIKEFILKTHALHDRKISDIARAAHDRKALLVLIAGPSASGKTTFSKKLAIQLEILGLCPVVFSVDDYYKPTVECPKNEHGAYDFECLEALRVDFLNQHLVSLLNGEVIEQPIYDFKVGRPLPQGRMIQLPKRAPIVIMEGIHCLNPKLTPLIPDSQKFKIFVAPMMQMNITEFNFIASSRQRLIRRIVRDFRTRGKGVQATFSMWPSVRQGEHQFIFPFINTADAILDTSLDYEFSALKIVALPLLSAVPPSDQFYQMARELMNFLSVFDTVTLDNIPADSLIREFIGGSFFETG